MRPRFDSRTRRHMWVEFVVGSHPSSEGFSLGTPVFLPPQNPKFPNSNSTWKQRMNSHSVDVAMKFPFSFVYLFIYLFYLFEYLPDEGQALDMSAFASHHSGLLLL